MRICLYQYHVCLKILIELLKSLVSNKVFMWRIERQSVHYKLSSFDECHVNGVYLKIYKRIGVETQYTKVEGVCGE